MLRRIRLVTTNGEAVLFIYYARNARFVGVQRVSPIYDQSIGIASMTLPVVYPGGIKMGVYQTGSASRTYDFYVDVPENQPEPEAVAETSLTKSSLTVYNENDVVICSNGVTVTSATSNPSQSATAPGEMTSVPGTAPGEMTSVPGEAPGEII